MNFKKLRLSGFKSFVEPTEIDIQAGLTGILGPNGCGKSNLVEALRWVMGETSAKRMRGGEMDDVIFAGSRLRPSRNLASVSVVLDNKDFKAPAAFNDQPSLEIVREIERGIGTNFTINGREVRAKDVQLLFADMATGAQATAIVRQGQIGALINAKPTERRALLEEAAGIKGLYARRHEADLKLKGAETNLNRVDDILREKKSALNSLRSQARQAAKYKEVNERLRQSESLFAHLQAVRLEQDSEQKNTAIKAIDADLETLMREAAGLSKETTEIVAKLPELRKIEAEAAAELQRFTIEQAHLAQEESRLESEMLAVGQTLEQISEDRARESSIEADATSTLAALQTERDTLTAQSQDQSSTINDLRAQLSQHRDSANELDATWQSTSRELAKREAEQQSFERELQQTQQKISSLQLQLEELGVLKEKLGTQLEMNFERQQITADLKTANSNLDTAQSDYEAAEKNLTAVESSVAEAREKLREAQNAYDRLIAEKQGLEKLLADTDAVADSFSPVLDAVRVERGYEAALAAALGDDLSASENNEAPRRWRDLGALELKYSLPEGVTLLSTVVEGPRALERSLTQVGLLSKGQDGFELQKNLKPGQRLVDADGRLWRWDGLVTLSREQSSAAANRLQQKNRLDEIGQELQAASSSFESAKSADQKTRADSDAAKNALDQARGNLRQAFATLDQYKQKQTSIDQQHADLTTRVSKTSERVDIITAELATLESSLAGTKNLLESALRDDGLAAKFTDVTKNLEAAKKQLVDTQARSDNIEREFQARNDRLDGITREQTANATRLTAAKTRLQQLADRQKDVEAKQLALQNRPQEIDAQKIKLVDLIDTAQKNRSAKAETLAQFETTADNLSRKEREAEHKISECKQNKVQLATEHAHLQQSLQLLAQQVQEKYDIDLSQLSQRHADVDFAALDYEEMRQSVVKLNSERESIGPVNLRAEEELAALNTDLDLMSKEREDLTEAIAKLRTAISTLNREGRERLLQSFEEVNKHFKELFEKLFGGGRAELTLVDSEDPLEAGLEILAQPPGKKLQTLSLLSGGEQALTTIALIFSVFLTNPAPICILDEVDAPLDDSNVGRFCNMLEEMSAKTSTAFMVITHHRMTMARMDRLYGVTMQEEGVSQLVSVDLMSSSENKRAVG